MKVLIVDDERHAREELVRLLKGFPDIQIVGEAANAREARESIRTLEPDLVFLDIQMPEETGFEMLDTLGKDSPRIIFTTAYDAYALRAFEFGAVDYLLKPIVAKRLAVALHRLGAADDSEQVAGETDLSFPEIPQKPLGMQDKVLLGNPDQVIYVAVEAIMGAESLGAYSKVWLIDGSVVIRRSLSVLEARLPPDYFIRANRSQLINLQQVQSVKPWFSGGMKLTLAGGFEVELSRRQAKLFRERHTL